jgi:hypothetical protein
MYAHDRDQRDPAIEGFQGGQLGPKTDEDWHTQTAVNALFFCFRSPQASYLEGMYMDNLPHHKDFTRSKPGDVSVFLRDMQLCRIN